VVLAGGTEERRRDGQGSLRDQVPANHSSRCPNLVKENPALTNTTLAIRVPVGDTFELTIEVSPLDCDTVPDILAGVLTADGHAAALANEAGVCSGSA